MSRKSDDVYLHFSHLQKFVPYEFTFHNWKRAPRYKNYFYLLDASFTAKPGRLFKLILPGEMLQRALLPTNPKHLMDEETLKVKLIKRDFGVIDLEVIR